MTGLLGPTGKVLGGKAPRCPLCVNNERVKEHEMGRKFVPQRQCYVFFCDNYKVAIKVDDPHVGKWEQVLALSGQIPCPNCDASMRYFSTSVGFMKAVCPKKSCGATLGNAEPDREKGKVFKPDEPGALQ